MTNVSTSLDITSTSLTQFTGTGTATSGNVITDVGTDGAVDARGPDSAAVLQVLKNGSYVSAGTSTTVQGQYGTLVISADGSYTYTPNGSPNSVGKVDVFSYQLVHPNGLSDTANLYVRIDSRKPRRSGATPTTLHRPRWSTQSTMSVPATSPWPTAWTPAAAPWAR